MNTKVCADKSLHIINEYYNNNNTEPFMNALVDNVIFHGPALGQRIEGLANMKKAWDSEQNGLTFSLGDMEVQYIQTSPASCEVMVMFIVTAHYPNGDALPFFQRAQYSWGDCNIPDENGLRKRIPKIFMVHISDPVEQHSDDYIYPTHYNEVYRNTALRAPQEPKISLRGTDNAFYVFAISRIMWVESQPEQHCIVHVRGRTLNVRASINEIDRLTEGHLVRVHSGYIINANDVVSVKRFKVTMSDGTEIPIPEKKYTAVKKLLLDKSSE